MYTEYVFENKKYEIASREIKATLFDIVAQEEEKIGDLREKAFVEENEAAIASELQALYVQQDSFLREILAISDKLTKALQRVDSCSRKLKQIESKTSAQTIVRENIAQTMKNSTTVKQEPTRKPVNVNQEEKPVMVQPATEEIKPVVKEEPVMEVPTTVNVGETKEGAASVDVPDIVMSFDDAEYARKQEMKATEENKEETVVMEVPVNTASESTNPPLITPVEEPMIVTEEVEKPVEIIQEEPVAVIQEEPTEVIQEEPTLTLIPEEKPVEENTQEEPMLTIIPEEQPALQTTEEVVEKPLVSDGDVLIPIATEFDKDEQELKLVFKKRNDDAPKVIMISGKQSKNLKGSLPTQEALLSAKGFFKNDKQPIEGEVVEDSDVTSKQEQIEEMMNQANELYAAGKVDEAQSMMNKVSTLNQELQGDSVGMNK